MRNLLIPCTSLFIITFIKSFKQQLQIEFRKRFLKYNFLAIIFVSLLFLLPTKTNAQVSLDKAKLIAKNHYWKYSSKTIPYQEIKPELIQIQKDGDFINYFAFNINDNQGFVIVSGDENKNPVIGYSFKGSFTITDENAPPEFVNIINHNSRKLDELKSLDIQNKKVWEQITQKNFPLENEFAISVVEPLIKSTWGQGEFYNDSVPEYEGNLMPVGCVATAMVQVMNYYKYPPLGSGENFYSSILYGYNVRANFGQTEYNWDNIPDQLESPNSSVAQLNYHASVSVNMNFTPTASGSSDEKARNALIKYFNYSSDIDRIYTDYYESIGNIWKDSLTNEL
ncbi:MAG: C10 family peptidase, partial [Prolixibacteraceae bacterium]|nr:C10 family peptidase [Prolixibacteraceae bacterium]